MADKNAFAEFLEQFTPSVVKQDESRTPYLIEHTGESKQADLHQQDWTPC
ncbi:hypothetical protein KW464_19930 [Vibrio fluvialis]|nr:hypothetical protein [Vibrio fluvialis]